MKKRTLFFISDRTAITAETLGHSLMTQFDDVETERFVIPFVDTPRKAEQIRDRINRVQEECNARPVVFSTFADSECREIVRQSNSIFYDFFDTFIPSLEAELQMKSTHVIGRSHGMGDSNLYESRIRAVHYALNNDDGLNLKQYEQSDVILIGVSRTGKTPTSLYLALQYGLNAANYPLTDTDLDMHRLPKVLKPFKRKIFGLTISPEQLQKIREERRPGSSYASLKQCQAEVSQVEELYQFEKIPFVNVTAVSIEEIAANVRQTMGFKSC